MVRCLFVLRQDDNEKAPCNWIDLAAEARVCNF